MADSPSRRRGSRRHLDASGPRRVVYCHLCRNEWHQDEHGLTCPHCGGEATEVVLVDSDPRMMDDTPDQLEDELHDRNSWVGNEIPDPEEGDVEEYISHSPGGHTTYFSQTFTTHGPRGVPDGRNRRTPDPNDPSNVLRDFHTMIDRLMGPGLRPGPPGRSGPDVLFPRGEPDPFPFPRRNSPFGGMAGGSNNGAHIVGHRFTFTTAGRRPRDAEAQDLVAEDFATILGGLFNVRDPPGQVPQPDGENGQRTGLPPGLQGLFASLFNPANAVAGDAVYSQEALDRIISTLMEQHPQSNAPGPASEQAIKDLPKKRLDENMLGPELKAECSVCMDDVQAGDEVVVLPCSHWFHEVCATAWLSEHNTCPICRKGIGSDQAPPNARSANGTGPSPFPMDESRARRVPNMRRSPTNEARLNAIRERGRLSPTPETSARRYPIVGDRTRSRNRTPSPPTAAGNFQRRNSEISEHQRESRHNASSSDRSRRNSNSTNMGESGNANGPMSWFRRLGGSRHRQD